MECQQGREADAAAEATGRDDPGRKEEDGGQNCRGAGGGRRWWFFLRTVMWTGTDYSSDQLNVADDIRIVCHEGVRGL